MRFRTLLSLLIKIAFSRMIGKVHVVVQPRLERTSLVAESLRLQGRIRTNVPMDRGDLIVRRFRGANQVFTHDLKLVPDRRNPLVKALFRLVGLRYYWFDLQLKIEWEAVDPGIFGFELHTDVADQIFHFGSDPGALGLFNGTSRRTFYTFIEPSVQIVRLEVHAIGAADMDSLKRKAEHPVSQVPSCVIGEYPDTARDNGYALFCALRAQNSGVKAFYVIDERNADHILADGDQILAWGSENHLAACINASVCAFTHHRNYIYPAILQHIAPDHYRRTGTVFLQHGVMAMKGGPVLKHYHKDRVNYDAIIVSSVREKAIFTEHFGYPSAAVHVTGLPRLDRLHRRSKAVVPAARQILVAPTWRPGLDKLSSDQIASDPYMLNWALAMREMTDKGFSPVLIGHQILKDHVSVLGRNAAEVSSHLEFQEALLQSSALVTDYSSVAWDALYVNRPAFLFQFDQKKTEFWTHAFIDEDELPGPISKNPVDLVKTLMSAADSGWAFAAQRQRDAAFRCVDAENMTRMIALIQDMARASVRDGR